MTENEKAKLKWDLLAEMKKEAHDAMSHLCHDPVENSKSGMFGGAKEMFEHGTWEQGAKAMFIAIEWLYAHLEECLMKKMKEAAEAEK